MKYIATISGGKDSVTMCDLLLKNNYKLDEIIFCDTLEEFNEMYAYIEKLRAYFKVRYNKDITILKPKTTFEDWAYGKITRGDRKGTIRGFPLMGGMCYWRRESKMKPIEEYLKNKFNNEVVYQYVGYTLEENRSIQDTNNFKYLYPLKDDFKMTENDCKNYLINQEMENPLYRNFSRTGCAMCPFQSEKSFYNVYKHYPDEWEKMKKREKYLSDKEVVNKYWFTKHRTCEDMEKEFNKKSNSLFDFSDEPLKDCFCKI